MQHIRYTARICNDKEKINSFLSSVRSGVIGINAGDYPYAVPVNFVWLNGSIYFHGMGSGKKFNLLSESPNVSFTVYEEIGTVTDPVPCHADTAYFSVMIFGKAQRVTDSTEAAGVLQAILEKFMPGFYKQMISRKLVENYHSSMDGNTVSVFRITPEELTAKENFVPPENIFSSGHPKG